MEILQLDVIWLFDDIPGLQWEQEQEQEEEKVKENNSKKKKKVIDCISSWEEMRKRTSLKNPLLLSFHQKENEAPQEKSK
jgi:citrate lyase alpha subunit